MASGVTEAVAEAPEAAKGALVFAGVVGASALLFTQVGGCLFAAADALPLPLLLLLLLLLLPLPLLLAASTAAAAAAAWTPEPTHACSVRAQSPQPSSSINRVPPLLCPAAAGDPV